MSAKSDEKIVRWCRYSDFDGILDSDGIVEAGPGRYILQRNGEVLIVDDAEYDARKAAGSGAMVNVASASEADALADQALALADQALAEHKKGETTEL